MCVTAPRVKPRQPYVVACANSKPTAPHTAARRAPAPLRGQGHHPHHWQVPQRHSGVRAPTLEPPRTPRAAAVRPTGDTCAADPQVRVDNRAWVCARMKKHLCGVIPLFFHAQPHDLSMSMNPHDVSLVCAHVLWCLLMHCTTASTLPPPQLPQGLSRE